MQLTKAEEQIMQILWELESATVSDILQKFENNKPARTTVATVLSVLENKGFVKHKTKDRVNHYQACVLKNDYSKKQMKELVKDYFNGSLSTMLSFFAKEGDISITEADNLLNIAKDIIEKEKSK